MQKVTMYQKDKGGNFKQWSCWSEGDKVFVEHGKEGGKLTVKVTTSKPKNVGRANETTGEQQAHLEATSKVEKQFKAGYREDKSDLDHVPILPMLAEDYLKRAKSITFPAIYSPKMDGVRCLALRHEDGRVELRSRGGEQYILPHVAEALAQIMEIGDIFDGEIYLHGESLEDIQSAVKRTDTLKEVEKAEKKLMKYADDEFSDDSELQEAQDALDLAIHIAALRPALQYHIFDVVSCKALGVTVDTQFSWRLDALRRIVYSADLMGNPTLFVVDQDVIFFREDVDKYHDKVVMEGYEGIMLRNMTGLYEASQRSSDLQKYKKFLDEEFEVVDVVEGKDGNAVLRVFCPKVKEKADGRGQYATGIFDTTFGDHAARRDQLANPEKYIGRYLKVKYQGRFKKTLVPQFPVGLCWREMDENGNPVD
ncbi:hypothetical protein [Pseudomonas aeruginosa]|uniref:ATP-dependent DNA ligase n=1 Tax=Pseudomonas aeruginosa TaxID=287 RepID=UPI001CBFA67F|nr:hypothetical protein [Pseudomonas aeruginosa]